MHTYFRTRGMSQEKRLDVKSDAEKLLGGPLNLRMNNFIRELSGIYASGKNCMSAFEFSYLVQLRSASRYQQITFFPLNDPPQNALEFLSCVKCVLIAIDARYAADLEAFFRLVPLLPKHQAFLDSLEEQTWLKILEAEAASSLKQKSLPQLRLRLIENAFIVESTDSREGNFRKLASTKMRDMWREKTIFENTSSEEIIRACCDYNDYIRSNELEFHDEKLTNLLAKLLRDENTFAQCVATEDGNPMPLDPHPLLWVANHKSADDPRTEIHLCDNDGQPVKDFLLFIPGKQPHVITKNRAYRVNAWPTGLVIEVFPLSIPKAALHSSAGLALFRKLGIPVPAEITQKIVNLSPLTNVHCSIKTPQYGGSELMIMEAYGGIKESKEVYSWEFDHWRLNKALFPQTKNIFEIDDSHLNETASWLKKLPFKPVLYGKKTQQELRVTKNFPDLFLSWMLEKPAATDVILDKELSDIVNGEVSGFVNLEIEESSTGIDWFDIHVNVTLSDSSLTPEEIALLLKAKGKWVKLQDKGWRKFDYTFSEETERELAEIGLNPHDLKGEKQKLHALQLGALAKKNSKLLDQASSEQITRRVNEIQTRVTPEIPANISAALRPYQLDGFHFLAYLTTNHFGGVLADDMGLGKTLQALTWLAWLHQNKGTKLPCLVVAPKSVQENWSAEATKFYPNLRSRTWKTGEIDDQLDPSQFDLLIINYAQLRNRSDLLNSITWLAVIVDEAQNIKNPASQSAQCARMLNANQRLALTGTPIENRLMDLWSIFSFAMPGALGTRANFTKSFDNAKDPFARRRLSARTRPFLLRRTKNEVAKELPDRIEEDITIELEGQQHKLYHAELKRARAHLLKASIPGQLDKLRFHLLSSLLRLRQICCHPALIGLEPDPTLPDTTKKTKSSSKKSTIVSSDPSAASGDSCKLEALLELLEPLIEEGQKILVFSQFVSMLEIIQNELQAREWKHFILTGKTNDRGELVNDFQTSEGAAVFLISLKAGGAGLNLTAASYVVLFDPWWNPAVEAQAIDRTHRIGQKSTVFAYRLVVKNTIEQKIRELQKSKSAVANDILGEENFARALTLNDFHFLLADG